MTTQLPQTDNDPNPPQRQIRIAAHADQAVVKIFTISFTWPMYNILGYHNSDPRGITLVKGQAIPAYVEMVPELKAVIDTLFELEEVAFVILPPSYGATALDVGRTWLASEEAILERVAETLKGFDINVEHQQPSAWM